MISFVIPVYRSSRSINELYRRIEETFEGCDSSFEVIFVEDCGGDNSWQLIKELSNKNSRVRGFQMSRNYGQHNALLCGIRHAKGDIVVTLDDDLQHPPEEIHKLLDRLKEGFDVVYGPPDREQHSLLRNLASKITKIALQSAMGASNAQNVSALRVFKTRLRDSFVDYRSPNVNIDVLLTWGTTNFSAVRVKHHSRAFGDSGYTLGRLLTHALNMITGFSTRPLQIASLMGLLFAGFGFVILIYVLLSWFLHGSLVPGFTFLASLVAIFSGAQLIALGIIGEYLARIHARMMERPAYLVAHTIP